MATVTTPRIRPYRRYLTSVFHRRFVQASTLTLLLCYVEAILLGSSRSCQSSIALSRAHVLTSNSSLVLVSHRTYWSESTVPLHMLPRSLYSSNISIEDGVAIDTIPDNDLTPSCATAQHYTGRLVVSCFSLVV